MIVSARGIGCTTKILNEKSSLKVTRLIYTNTQHANITITITIIVDFLVNNYNYNSNEMHGITLTITITKIKAHYFYNTSNKLH